MTLNKFGTEVDPRAVWPRSDRPSGSSRAEPAGGTASAPALEEFFRQFLEPVILHPDRRGGHRRCSWASGSTRWRSWPSSCSTACFGFLQEERAERALAALQRAVGADGPGRAATASCRPCPARELVPGDRIELEAGDHVPADARLIRALRPPRAGGGADRRVDAGRESTPTPCSSRTTPLGDRATWSTWARSPPRARPRPWSSPPACRPNWAGSPGCSSGTEPRAHAAAAPAGRTGASVLVLVVCLAAVAVIFVLQVLHGARLSRRSCSRSSLAVAAVPEGLPAVVTLALAVGLATDGPAQRPGPQAAERRDAGLGHGDLLGQDRHPDPQRDDRPRGRHRRRPLRRHRRRLRPGGTVPPGRRSGEPTGVGYRQRRSSRWTEPDLLPALLIAAWCNNARLLPDGDGDGPSLEVIGDPTEGALVVAGPQGGRRRATDRDGAPLHEIPFDSERKAMSVVVRGARRRPTRCYTKGATEVDPRRSASDGAGGEAGRPLDRRAPPGDRRPTPRMAAAPCGCWRWPSRHDSRTTGEHSHEEDLVFVGLVGHDRPAPRRGRDAAVAPAGRPASGRS